VLGGHAESGPNADCLGVKVQTAVWFKKGIELNPLHLEWSFYEKMIAEGAPPSANKRYGRPKVDNHYRGNYF